MGETQEVIQGIDDLIEEAQVIEQGPVEEAQEISEEEVPPTTPESARPALYMKMRPSLRRFSDQAEMVAGAARTFGFECVLLSFYGMKWLLEGLVGLFGISVLATTGLVVLLAVYGAFRILADLVGLIHSMLM